MTYVSLRRASSVVAIVSIFAACAAPAPAGLTDADRAAIQEVTDEFVEAFLAGDFAGVASFYTEDAVLLPPNAPSVSGRAAIQEFLATFPPVTQFHLTNVTIEGSGDIAFVHGTLHMVMTGPDGSTIEDTGKFIEIRRKVGDRWLLAYDIFNSDLPLPMP
jgi:uncharacterized protein (TIGR02246 family)